MVEQNTSPSSESLDQTFGIYNPGALPPAILLDHFIARKHQLNKALDIVRNNQPGEAQQHLLVIGPRGMGKTMLLLALAYSVQNDPELGKDWLPVIFPEETYGIGDLADFWLSVTEHLLQALGKEVAIAEVDALRAENSEDIEGQAQALFLRHLDQSGRRALIVLENLHDFFDSVSDKAEQHRLRAFLMDNDRVMVAASSPTYFDATGQMEMPFYDFFRIMRLERFSREEMLDVFRQLAKQRGDAQVEEILEHQPERVDSLRVLTGGNPRLIKMVYRLLSEGGTGSARQDLDRLIEDCTPYFKHRIEELSGEVRRVFDHVAKHWEPVAVGDIQTALRRPSNKISTYLRRLMNEGFLEEAAGSTAKRKMYQVAERFYNIYYLMRFSRSGKRRLTWLVQAMRVLYSEQDFKTWAERTLDSWKNSTEPGKRAEHEAFLYSLTRASDCVGLQSDLVERTIATAWETDQLDCLNRLIDQDLGHQALGSTFDLITFFATLPAEEKKRLGYNPKDAEWWYLLAEPLEKQRLYDAAKDAFQKSIELDPRHAAPWNNLANLLCDHFGKYDEAEAAYRKASDLDPANAMPYNGLANLLYDHFGKYNEAETAYRKAIELDPKDAAPWNNLANLLYDHFGKYDEAEAAYRKAIELDPKDAMPYNGLANLLQTHFGRYDEAEAAYRKAIELEPTHAMPYNGLAKLLYDHFGKYGEAQAAYRKAIKLDPNFAYPWNNLANLLNNHFGKYVEAEAAYRKAIELDPNFAYPWNNLANLLCDHFGKYEEAEAAYRKTIELDPNYASPVAGLANLLGKTGQSAEGEALALRAVTLAPEEPWPRRCFIEICGENAEAWKQLLPYILRKLARETKGIENAETEDGLYGFTMRGLEFLLSSKTLSFSDALALISDAGAEAVLEPVVIALRAGEDESVLAKASPEHRIFAEEFLVRLRAAEAE